MAYECKIIADSISEIGCRLTTFEVTLPRIVLAELNTHRSLSRNSASSRAIPVEKMIRRVQVDPFVPIYWGKNQKGMQAAEEMDSDEQAMATDAWLDARDSAVKSVEKLIGKRDVYHPTEKVYYDNSGTCLPDMIESKPCRLDTHKQIANRLLEPFLWHTAIITATDYANFFAQRCHKDAQPEIRRIAEMMRDLYDTHEPAKLNENNWHLPYVSKEDALALIALDTNWPEYQENLKKVSVARAARVSYLTQDGKRDVSEDIALFDRLVDGMHMSPFEHVAQAMPTATRIGNFVGWRQFRKSFPNENRTEYPHAA